MNICRLNISCDGLNNWEKFQQSGNWFPHPSQKWIEIIGRKEERIQLNYIKTSETLQNAFQKQPVFVMRN